MKGRQQGTTRSCGPRRRASALRETRAFAGERQEARCPACPHAKRNQPHSCIARHGSEHLASKTRTKLEGDQIKASLSCQGILTNVSQVLVLGLDAKQQFPGLRRSSQKLNLLVDRQNWKMVKHQKGVESQQGSLYFSFKHHSTTTPVILNWPKRRKTTKMGNIGSPGQAKRAETSHVSRSPPVGALSDPAKCPEDPGTSGGTYAARSGTGRHRRARRWPRSNRARRGGWDARCGPNAPGNGRGR